MPDARGRRLLVAALCLVVAGTTSLWNPAPAAASGAVAGASMPDGADVVAARTDVAAQTYYVDSADGDDAASGLDEGHAWRSLDRINATAFGAGDRILLRAGGRWHGQLWPKGSGVAGSPITVDRYGDGAKPRIDGDGAVGDVVRLFNQEYWTVRNLEVTNEIPVTGTPGENLRDLRGIHVSGDDSQTLDGFVVDGVYVHDVTGQVNWIGGSIANNAPGIHFQTGWDGSKKTGGIVFDTTVPDITAPPTTPTRLNDVRVENSTIVNTSFAGIVFKQYTGDGKNEAGQTVATATGWGNRKNAADPAFAPHTDILIRNNYITQAGTEYGCNGIYLTNVRHAVVEHNVVHRTGTSGIEMYFADDVTVQFNEVYRTEQKAGGADSNGIDPDKGTTGQLIQYNYVHDNGDGILICQFSFGNTVVRNNVIAGNSRYQIYLHSDKAATAKIYHNTVYNDRSDYLVYGYGSSLAASYQLRDNILASTRAGAVLTTSPTITYDRNLYHGSGLSVPDSDADPIVADPLFAAAPLTGPSGTAETGPQLDSALGLRVRSGSPAINTGVAVEANGGRDYAGGALYNDGPDRGAFEYRTAPGATTESVTGRIRTPDGQPVSGAVVAVAGAPDTATTRADGRFAVLGVPFGGGRTVTAKRSGYLTATATVDVPMGNTATVDLTMAAGSEVGSISGRVLDQAAHPVAGARVTVGDGEQTVGAASSAADGTFSVAGLPVGGPYSVRAEAGGFTPATRSGVAVASAATTAVGALLLTRPIPDYLAVHDFDAMATGDLPTGTQGLAVSAAGGRVQVVETPSAADKSVKLTRTTNSGSTSLSRTFTPPLSGIVTVEANVMIDEPYVAGNQFWAVPYIRNAAGQNAISVALTKNTVVAYAGTASRTVGTYELGRWYHVATVIDTVNQRFDLFVDGVRVLDDAAFRTSMDGVAQVDYYANSSNYGSVHVDDVRVAQGIGLTADDAGMASLNTDAGQPVADADGGYLLDVPARVGQVAVTAVARSPFARSVSIAGVVAAGPQATRRIPLGATGAQVDIQVTAEDGSTASYPLRIRRQALAADATLSGLLPSAGTLDPAFDPDVTSYALAVPVGAKVITLTPAATNPRSVIRVAGRTVSSGDASPTIPVPNGDSTVVVEVTSEDGTAHATYTILVSRPTRQLPPDGASRRPGKAVLSTTSGWRTGLHDGTYDVTMNLWWGDNGSVFVLYENGVEIARQELSPATPAAQTATVSVTGRRNGVYVYTGELLSQAGLTETDAVTVTVTDANPGKPVVSSDNWDGDGDFTMRMNLWWGTNADEYRLYEDGVLVDTQKLTAATPGAQQAGTVLAGRSPGTYTYVVELRNAAGSTRSDPVEVTVTR